MQHHRVELGRDARGRLDRARRRRLLLDMGLQDLVRRAGEHGRAGEQLVADAADRVQVGTRLGASAPSCLNTCKSETPSTYSIDRKNRLSSSWPKLYSSTMFGWRSRLTARASRRNRDTNAGFCASEAIRIFSASRRPVSR